MSGQVVSGDFNFRIHGGKEYIPVVSTILGLRDLALIVYMVFFEVFPRDQMSGSLKGMSEQGISRLRDFHLVDRESVFRCCIILIPIIGNVIIFILDCVNRENVERSHIDIRSNCRDFLLVDAKIRDDQDFVLDALKENPGVAPFISKALISDDDFMRKVVLRNPQMFRRLGEERRNDEIWAKMAIGEFLDCQEFPGRTFDSDALISLLRHVGPRLRNDSEFILWCASVTRRGFGLDEVMSEYVSKERINDGRFFRELVKARRGDVNVLCYAGIGLRSSIDNLKPLLIEHPAALEYASDDIKNDKRVIREILGRRMNDEGCDWYEFAGEGLRGDSAFVEWAIDELDQHKVEDIVHYSTQGIKGNKALMLRAVVKTPCCYRWFDDELRTDRDIMLAVAQRNGYCLVKNCNNEIARAFENDPDIAIAASINYPDIFRFFSDEVQGSKEVTDAIIAGLHERERNEGKVLSNDVNAIACICAAAQFRAAALRRAAAAAV